MRTVVLGLLLLAQPAAASPGPILVLPLEGDRKDVREVAKKVSKALAKKKRRPTTSTRTMAQLQEAANCTDDSPPCLTSVGQRAGADEFVFGSVLRDGRILHILLRRFSVAEGREMGRAQADVRRPSSRAIGKLVSQLMRKAPPQQPGEIAPGVAAPTFGTLEVLSALPDVLIRINGQPRGTAPLRLDDIGAATYDIEAEREGFRTWRGQAIVEAGKLATVQVALDPLPTAFRPRPQGAGEATETGLTTRTWIAGGLTAALLTGAAVFGALTLSAQNDFDADAEKLAPGDPEASQRALGLENRADSGKQKALIANVLFAAAGAAAVATGVFVVLDLTDDSGAPATTLVVQPGGLTVRY